MSEKSQQVINSISSSFDDIFEPINSDKDVCKKEKFPTGISYLNGICKMCMQGDCLTKATVEDGIVTKIDGHPDSPTGGAQLCPRGKASLVNLYYPYRLKFPLKRTNPEKGLNVDPRWMEVSWDEALSVTASKMKDIYENDPRELAICEGFGIRDAYPILKAFVDAFNTPNLIGSHGVICSVHFATNLVQASHPISVPDFEYCNYLITIGRSNGANFATVPGTRRMADALDRGMKMVVVDPRCSPEASMGEWVPIRPGTDLAFILSLAHVIFYEIETIDEWSLKNRTNAPYLIDKNGDYLRDEINNKPLVWQNNKGCAIPFDQAIANDLALFGCHEVDNKKYKTALQAIKDSFQQYTPEWAENICDVPANTIRKIAHDFIKEAHIGETIEIDGFTFPYRPVSINCERGCCDHQGGTYADLTTKIINMLVGSIEVPGGCLASGKRGPILIPDEDGIVTPAYESVGVPFKYPPDHVDMAEFYPHRHTAPHLAVRAILDPKKYHLKYKVRAWMSFGGNPIRRTGEPDLIVKALKRIEFLCSVSTGPDESMWMSDIVLPESHFLERDSLRHFEPQHQSTSFEVNGLRMVMARQPIPAMFNTKYADDILIELADRIGILFGPHGLNNNMNTYQHKILHEDGLMLKDPYKLDLDTKYKIVDIYNHLARSYFDAYHLDYPFVQKRGFVHYRLDKKECYNYYYYPDDKTRHPIYFSQLKNSGTKLINNCKSNGICIPSWNSLDHISEFYRAIPKWIANSEFDESEEYPLYAINWKTVFFTNGVGEPEFNHILQSVEKKAEKFDNIIWINEITAHDLNIDDGKKVRVESRYGFMTGIVKKTQLIHPKTIGIPGNFLRGKFGTQTSFNNLLSTDETTGDPVNTSMEVSPRVKIKEVNTCDLA